MEAKELTVPRANSFHHARKNGGAASAAFTRQFGWISELDALCREVPYRTTLAPRRLTIHRVKRELCCISSSSFNIDFRCHHAYP
jgi:hypothetical protein